MSKGPLSFIRNILKIVPTSLQEPSQTQLSEEDINQTLALFIQIYEKGAELRNNVPKMLRDAMERDVRFKAMTDDKFDEFFVTEQEKVHTACKNTKELAIAFYEERKEFLRSMFGGYFSVAEERSIIKTFAGLSLFRKVQGDKINFAPYLFCHYFEDICKELKLMKMSPERFKEYCLIFKLSDKVISSKNLVEFQKVESSPYAAAYFQNMSLLDLVISESLKEKRSKSTIAI